MSKELEQQIEVRNSDPSDAPNWRIEIDLDRTGAYHMERDEQLARELLAGTSNTPVLRLYSWNPPAVSIGYQQKIEAIDLEACRRAGVDVVRRPTGGRAVLHWNELTYAVIMRSSGQGIYATHNLIVEALLRSLEDLGEPVGPLQITGRDSDRGFKEIYSEGKPTNIACFASTARHEATFQGRKIIGSAQRRFGDVLLQHGSILLTTDHLQLPGFLAMNDDRRALMKSLLAQETATLSEAYGRELTPAAVADCVAKSFSIQAEFLLSSSQGIQEH